MRSWQVQYETRIGYSKTVIVFAQDAQSAINKTVAKQKISARWVMNVNLLQSDRCIR